MTPALKRRLRRLIKLPSVKFPSLVLSRPRLSWLFVLIYVVGILFVAFGPIFRLRKFSCQTNTGEPCPDFIVPELAKKKGELAYLCQTSALIQSFGQILPQAEQISIQAQWPNVLATDITWQPGIANLQIPASTSAILVSKSGQLITLMLAPDLTLPTIVASSAADLIISDQLHDPSLLSALELIKLMEYYSIPIDEINVISPIDIRVFMKNQKISIFTSQKSISAQVDILHLILIDPTMNPNLPVIDVRYDRPALKPALPI